MSNDLLEIHICFSFEQLMDRDVLHAIFVFIERKTKYSGAKMQRGGHALSKKTEANLTFDDGRQVLLFPFRY